MGNLETFNKREYVESQCQCEKPKTNADRIRNMSDEELAEVFYTENYLAIKNQISETKEEILEWLQSEVEEGVE